MVKPATLRHTPATPTERLNRIVEDGLCLGCGLCESIAGSDRISMRVGSMGYLRPAPGPDLTQEMVDEIYDTCPGLRQDSLPEQYLTPETTIDPVWGPVISMCSAHATDDTTRIPAASGGVLTALCKYLVETAQVDFILHTKIADDDPTFGQAHISHNAEDVAIGSGSVYGPCAPLTGLVHALGQGRPFAFVGKPCDISAVRNFARFDSRVDALVKFFLTPVCGGTVPPPQMDKFLSEKGISRSDLKSFRYRGDGCPGDTEYESQDGQKGSANMYEPYGGVDETSWQLPFRCKICPDGPGEAADISAGDEWQNAEPDWELAKSDKGRNAVIVRTDRGQTLFNDAVKAGYLTVLNPITPRYYDTCQPHQVAKKMHTRSRWNGLAEGGSLMPSAHGLRLDEFQRGNSAKTNGQQQAGTLRRIKDSRETN